MSSVSRLHYFAPVNTAGYAKHIQRAVVVGAASNKVLSVSRALKMAGVDACVVSAGDLGAVGATPTNAPVTLTEDGVVINYFSSRTSGMWARLCSSVNYLRYAAKSIGRRDVVLLYNFFPEYILPACFLRLKGTRVYLDIEDAPNAEKNARERVGRLSLSVLLKVCQPRQVTAATVIDRHLALVKACNIYGAVKGRPPVDRDFLSDVPDELRIIFGGTLNEAAGLNLLCQALLKLAPLKPPESGKVLHFIFTGFGGDEQIADLRSQLDSSFIKITQASNLSRESYLAVLQTAHAGLSLKLMTGLYGDTTFPSKVLEITAQGLLLIATRASDVPLIFGPDEALFCKEETPESLAALLLWVARNPQLCQEIARRGSDKCIRFFDEHAVGVRLRNFLFQDSP